MSQITFQYKAIGASGRTAKGHTEASDRDQAYQNIVAMGLRPITIVQKRAGGLRLRRKKVSLKDLSHLTFQFSVLIDARIPIADGLHSIAEQETNEQLKKVITEIATNIESGETISASMEPHRDIFGEVYLQTIRAAEVSGNLSNVLAHLAQMLDQQYETNKNIKSAMMYPMCVIGALTLAVAFLVVFVIPKFAEMFEARGVELPLLTRALMAVGQFGQSYWFIIIPTLISAVVLFKRMYRDEQVQRKVDNFMHKIPHLRDLLIGIGISRFCHIFGLSLRSGLSLIDALDMGGASSGRPLLQADTQLMREQVNQGGRLTDVLSNCDYIPPFSRRMLAAGEEAGELPKMCDIIARHYDREVAHLAKNISTIIEPIMIVGLAAIVLVIALAIFLPMWNLAVVIG